MGCALVLNVDEVRRLEGMIEDGGVSARELVDAMLGIGFCGNEVREPLASWISAVNERRAAASPFMEHV